ncbi:hypothetical protein [Sphingomonas sp.]|uniref:CC0125/CC1285 family lipoprotein n=1 Tax=Sphingomonas sp. TaxID=28214 RepID=UPI001EB6FC2B|nr:hypothetical protein [Sphingomonas sp.]MBX3594563.1 hypothetical protein [Sphingomonas sp.]
MRISQPRRMRAAAAALALASASMLASCAMPTAYQPATGTGTYRTGYWDEQIEADRFRVTFAGNNLTSRETVERYLLYRAAQLTVERGFDYFTMADRDTEKRSRTYVNEPFGPGPWGYWGPSWRYYGPRWGWRSWDPFWGDPFWGRSVDVRTVDRYEATAEIVTGRGRKPDNVRSFDARQVLANLGPSIQQPAAPTR